MAFKLQDDQGYRVFGLEIQGLMTRFYMGANPFTASSLYDLVGELQPISLSLYR